MNISENPPRQPALTVYKASAGSGKTFRLAIEYIKLLMDNPQNYRSILAVTFTNKATGEMKMRILSQLYGIAHQLAESEAYTRCIIDEMGMSREMTAQRANEALHLLLHNYSFFRVETIDSFFQSILRNLARELDLAANLRIDLDEKQVEQQAVDQLINELDKNSKVLKWILSYIKQNIEANNSWNVIKDIKEFGQNLFKDEYKSYEKELRQQLGQEGFFEEYTQDIRKIKTSAEERLKTLADPFFTILEREQVSLSDFSGGESRSIGNYFKKIKNGEYRTRELLNKTVVEGMENLGKWLTNSKQAEDGRLCDVVTTQLMPLLNETETQRKSLYRLYNSALRTLQNMNQLRLLNSIDKKIRAINTEDNRFLLCDTQALLNSLIEGSDSPFIFEKIGTQVEHIMIDEFQDTSIIQWKNFKVLLEECMSREKAHNLVVGDVKQSIYRWRNGDWRLLNNIENEIGRKKSEMTTRELRSNYRSQANIIRFNNAFFTQATQMTFEEEQAESGDNARQVLQAYSDVEQLVPDGGAAHGLVQVDLLDKEDYEESSLQQLAETLFELKSRGVRQNDIAILVRKKDTIQLIADFFSQNHPDTFSFISEEAFRLDSSASINIIVNALKIVHNPTNQIALANLSKLYQQQVLKQAAVLADGIEQARAVLPASFINCLDDLSTVPLLELTDFLLKTFQLQKIDGQDAYICLFHDVLNDFLNESSSNLEHFLENWEQNLCGKTIQTGQVEGIQIMTIHKSKGLEFEHVIMPFCDWKVSESRNNLHWCKTQEAPFNRLVALPIDVQPNLKESIFEKDYQEEHLQNTIDNMNLLYVGFTRACSSLFVMAKRFGGKNTRSAIFPRILPQLQSVLEGSQYQEEGEKTGKARFTFGSLYVRKNDDGIKKVSENKFSPQKEDLQFDIQYNNKLVEFRQSNKSHEFALNTENPQEGYIQMGNILHHLFSQIKTTADIEKLLNQLEFEGILYDRFITKQGLKRFIDERFGNRTVKHWFSDNWTLFNECTILSVDDQGQIRQNRPDRVMVSETETIVVDFKFGKPQSQYHEQVRQYVELLQSMGFENVQGYLWFVYDNTIEAVRQQ